MALLKRLEVVPNKPIDPSKWKMCWFSPEKQTNQAASLNIVTHLVIIVPVLAIDRTMLSMPNADWSSIQFQKVAYM
jgi:hypothetical protein